MATCYCRRRGEFKDRLRLHIQRPSTLVAPASRVAIISGDRLAVLFLNSSPRKAQDGLRSGATKRRESTNSRSDSLQFSDPNFICTSSPWVECALVPSRRMTTTTPKNQLLLTQWPSTISDLNRRLTRHEMWWQQRGLLQHLRPIWST